MADVVFFNRVEMSTTTLGTGTVTFAGVTSSDFMSPLEAGATDGDQTTYVIEEGADFEIGLGTIGSTSSTITRDTVYKSKKSGVIGTDKMDLGGTATIRLMPAAEAFNTLWSTTSYWAKAGDVVHTDDFTFVVGNVDGNGGKWHVFNKATAVVGNLPVLATTLSDSYLIRNIGSGTLTLEPNAAEQIENLVNLTVPTGRAVFVWPNVDRTMWRSITLGFDFSNPLILTDFLVSGGNFSNVQSLVPAAGGTVSLGDAADPWDGIYLKANGVGINFANGDVTIRNSAANTLAFAGASSGYVFDTTIKVPAGSTGGLDFGSGDATIKLAAANALTFAGSSNGYFFDFALVPTASDGAAIGSATNQWSDLFGASGFVWNLANGDYTVTHSTGLLTYSGGVTVNGTTTLKGVVTFNGATDVVVEVGRTDGTAGLAAFDFHTSATPVDYNARIIASGNVGIGAGTLQYVAAAHQFSSAISPAVNDASALGTTALQWSDLFGATGFVWNLGNGNYTVTHSSGLMAFSGAVQVGSQAAQSTAKLSVRGDGNCIEFGHSNTAGYGSTLGSDAGGGSPFLAFDAEAGTTSNTYKTRGNKGTILKSDNSGGFRLQTVATASADNQTATDLFTISNLGAINFFATSVVTNMIVKTTDPGATGVIHVLFHDSVSPAAADQIAFTQHHGRNSAAADITYHQEWTQLVDVTAGTEDSSHFWQNMVNGVSTTQLSMTATGVTVSNLLTLTAGQVAFPAAQNASAGANTFDDYEEGTFSPTAQFGGASTGVTYASVNLGNYTKVGNRVLFTANLALTSKGSSTGASGIGGFPFTSDATTGNNPSFAVWFTNMTGLTGSMVAIKNNGDTTGLFYQTSATACTGVVNTAWTNTSQTIINGHYNV